MFMVPNFVIRRKVLEIIITFLFGLSVGVIGIKILCQFNLLDLNTKQYVYVDVEKVINSVNESLVKQAETGNISETQVSDKLMLAKNKFNFLLKNYTQNHNAVVFSSSKVIAGANDITEYFTKGILVEIK
jgi:hypothetical protein